MVTFTEKKSKVTFTEKSTKKSKPSEKKFNSNSKPMREIDCGNRENHLKKLHEFQEKYKGTQITDYTYEELKKMLKWNR